MFEYVAHTGKWRESAWQIVKALEAMPEAWPFLRPVTEEEAPGYFTEIKHPMDLRYDKYVSTQFVSIFSRSLA